MILFLQAKYYLILFFLDIFNLNSQNYLVQFYWAREGRFCLFLRLAELIVWAYINLKTEKFDV